MVEDTSKLSQGIVLNNKYMILQFLKEGGFSNIYKAENKVTNKPVIIKEFYLKEYFGRDLRVSKDLVQLSNSNRERLEIIRNKFLMEKEILSSISGLSGVAKMIESFEENNTNYITMELIPGDTIRQLINSKALKSIRVSIILLIKILNILSRIHGLQIVHNDLSPDNIIITPEGEPVIIDFGNACRISSTIPKEDLAWTPGFTAFENYSNNSPRDERCDIYSVACIGYFLLTGEAPPDALDRTLNDDINFPNDIPDSLKNVLLQGISLDADKRYRNVEEFSSALKECLIYKENKKDSSCKKINVFHIIFNKLNLGQIMLMMSICILFIALIMSKGLHTKDIQDQIVISFSNETDNMAIEECYKDFYDRIKSINAKDEISLSFNQKTKSIVIIPESQDVFEEWYYYYPYLNHIELLIQPDICTKEEAIKPEYIEKISLEYRFGGLNNYYYDYEYCPSDQYDFKFTLNEQGVEQLSSIFGASFEEKIGGDDLNGSDLEKGFLKLWITENKYIKEEAEISYYKNTTNSIRVSFRYPKRLLPIIDKVFSDNIIPITQYYDNYQEKYHSFTYYDYFLSQ